jgi:hypothetical protein
MMYRSGVIGIGNAHGADGDDDAGGQIMEIPKQNGGQGYTYRDAYSASQIMTVDKPLIFPNIIHVLSENTGKLYQTNFYAITFVN